MGRELGLPKNIRQIGEIQGEEKVCLEDYVMTCIHKKEPQEKEGYLGIFYGERQKTEDGIYVFVRGILEIPSADEEEQIATHLSQQKQNYFPDWEVQGCCVIGPYPTERMKYVETVVPGACDLIYHLQEQEEHLYWTLDGRYKKLKGYFVFYEQNRSMQRYLSEEFLDDSVEKESLPDRAIRSFREKIQEKAEKKTGSMLKLASSFFVVTVLVIGAVAVTRMDRAGGVLLKQKEELEEENSREGQIYRKTYPEEVPVSSNEAVGVSYGTDTDSLSFDEANAGTANTDAQADGTGAEAVNADAARSEEQLSEGTDTDSLSFDEANAGAANAGAQADGTGAEAVNADAARSEEQLSEGTDTDLLSSDEANAGAANAGAQADGTGAEAVNADAARSEEQLSEGTDTDLLSSDEANAGAANADAQTVSTGAATVNTDTETVSAGTGMADAEAAKEGSMGAEAEAAGQSQPASSDRIRSRQASYTIREGDTLADICSKYYGSLDKLNTICEVNRIEDANRIIPGQKIMLP